MTKGSNDPRSVIPEAMPAVGSFDWREYLLALKQRLWLIVLCTIAGVATATYQVNKAVPIYASRSVLMFEPQEDRILNNIQSVRSDTIVDAASFTTMLETLTSRTMMERVVTRLKLDRDSVFMPKPEGREANTLDAASAVLRNCVRASRRGETRLIDIVVEHSDPETAKKIADAFATDFIRFRFEVKSASNQLANQFLLEEVNRLKEKINRAEVSLHDFREKKGLISLDKSQDVVVSRFMELNNQLNQARDRRLQLEADMAGALRAGNNSEELLKLPSIAQHPSVASLMTGIEEKQAEISALSQRYKPKHPKYAAAVAQLESMKGRLPEAALAAASVMHAALQSAKETEERVANEAKGQEKDTYSLGKMQVEYDSIKRDIETDKTLFNSVLARLKETDITKSLDQSMIKVVEPAVASYVPVRPDKQKMLAQWSLGGLALGLMLAIGLHLMDSSFKTVDDAERALQLPVLSAVTVRKTTARKNPIPDLETIHQKHSPVSESFRTLRSSLILLGNADRRHIIMFTSAVPAEGKTFCAANYAVTLANQGLKTVLIDCDLRKPSIAEIFIDKAPHLGVADQLAGQCELDEVVRSTPVPNLDVIPAGSPSPNPSELLSGQSFLTLLTELRQHYEKIVIDSAPVLAVSDPLVIAPHVDTICLVVRSHKTSRHSAIRACAAIAKTGKMPSGLVLNRLPIAAAGYYYYYGSRYGQKKVYGAPG